MPPHFPVRPAIVTAICFVMATFAWGTVFYGHSVYMDALVREHGWSSALISSAILMFWIASLPGTLSVGLLVDRFGPALVVVLGGVCISGGLVSLAWITSPWQLFFVYTAMGFGYPALAGAAISATLVRWFDRGFGTALGIALTGASVGGALFPLFIIRRSADQGFGATMTAVAGALLAVVLVAGSTLALLGQPKTETESGHQPERFSMRSLLRRALFWRISVAAAIGLGGQVGLLAHQVPIIVAEFDPITASLTVTVVAIASAIGRLVVGILSRYFSVSILAAFSYALHGAGIAVLVIADTAPGIFAGCALAGLFVGAIVMLPPILVREAFGITGFGRTYAMVNVVMYVMAGLSPWVVGIIKSETGGYAPGLWMLVGMEVLAAFLVFGVSGQARAKT
ncbi:MAG: MFS transporter [Rhodospirillaceae bacterium]|nr:MFS transporter [Rhodospirillaceae bacterium]